MATPVLRRSPAEENDSFKALNFLQELLREYHPRNFAVEFWDGTCWEPEPGQFRRFGWKINRAGALRAVFSGLSQLAFVEAFIYGEFDLDGDIEGLFPLLEYLINKSWSVRQKSRLELLLAALPGGGDLRPVLRGPRLAGRLHSRERDRAAIEYHYGLSNDFYSLWLDKQMVYSCAYFSGQTESLEVAQRAKLEYVCRKLQLHPGERLLDIGCGWGGLIIHAAREYGMNAVGITLSEQERQLAELRIQQADLGGRCQVKLLDYRDLAEPEAYDKVASLEMLGHVGTGGLADYFRQVFRMLRPGGVFLNQFMAPSLDAKAGAEPSFHHVYAFPDAELCALSAVNDSAEAVGFDLRDLENLREHYALTLRHWAKALEQNADQSRRLLDEVTYRIWKLHLAGWAHEFSVGRLNLYQARLIKNGREGNGTPLTREDWYAKREPVKKEIVQEVEKETTAEWTP
jgi:cyclopropane-fatty-acyl-phospholipid synthase